LNWVSSVGSSGREEGDSLADREPEGSKNQPDRPEPETLYGVKAMKAKKREFLKKRKLRKRGKGGGEDEGEGALEASVMTDRHKPAFGEQAMQPLKVQISLVYVERSPAHTLMVHSGFPY
jgi:hypothetical protein